MTASVGDEGSHRLYEVAVRVEMAGSPGPLDVYVWATHAHAAESYLYDADELGPESDAEAWPTCLCGDGPTRVERDPAVIARATRVQP